MWTTSLFVDIMSPMSIKNFFIKKMLASKMKGVPQAEQEKIFSMLEKNPQLFEKIGLEVQEEMKKGLDQMTATMNVVKKYESDLKSLM
ncbi:MAG: hypothetical protein CEO12_143 [Parcubacteria group bacterium Gr01-1014_46]|nr:MAG: hypothetical protein CEO12_143 [Parcubacteria group bacterium Gr01-1014_46]